jgi:hypothetical protein
MITAFPFAAERNSATILAPFSRLYSIVVRVACSGIEGIDIRMASRLTIDQG